MKTNGKRLLVVDDEEGIREVVAYEFRRAGYEVFEATSGMEALAFVQKAKVDLIISDVRMPYGDGLYLLEKLGRSSLNIPVIIMTGYSDQQTNEAVLKGASAVISKPFQRSALVEAAAQALARR